MKTSSFGDFLLKEINRMYNFFFMEVRELVNGKTVGKVKIMTEREKVSFWAFLFLNLFYETLFCDFLPSKVI